MLNVIKSQFVGWDGLSLEDRIYASLACIFIAIGTGWYCYNRPLVVGVFAVLMAVGYGVRYLINIMWQKKISYRNLVMFVVAGTVLYSRVTTADVANAVFLNDLETFTKNVFAGTNAQAGGEQEIEERTIGLFFNVIRGIFLLAVSGASLFAISQAMRGGDWMPIVQQVAMAFAAVMAIDIITLILVGNPNEGNAEGGGEGGEEGGGEGG